MKYGEMALMNALIDKMGGMRGVKRFLSGELVLVEKSTQIAAKLDWRKVYKALGMITEYDSEIASLAISEQEGLWTIPVLKGVTCNKVVASIKESGGSIHSNYDVVLFNDRSPNNDGSYSVCFKQNIEADEENKNLSADSLRNKEVKGITLLERLLLGFGYLLATGSNLDKEGFTRCAGSRDSNDNVPIMYCDYDNSVYVTSFCSDGGDNMRTRSVVSCQP
ncbi:MAG: hypothetical protein AAB957_00005 [Patescibacteria group bacterium]